MPVDLGELLAPGRCAVLTMELQRGVVGEQSSFPELAAAVAIDGVVVQAARLVTGARAAGVPVVHCTAGFPADGTGWVENAPLISAMARRHGHLLEGTEAVQLVPELGPEPTDRFAHRRHGVAPFGDTDLHAQLQALGVDVVVACGVSLNLGIPGLCVEAVDLGYHVVVARQAVAGVPADYARAVLEHTLRLVALVADVDEIVASWPAIRS